MTKSVLSWLARPYANPHATMYVKIDSDPHCILSVFLKKTGGGRASPPKFYYWKELQSKCGVCRRVTRKEEHAPMSKVGYNMLGFQALLPNYKIFANPSHYVPAWRGLVYEDLIIPSISQILQRRVSRINSQRVASKWEGCVRSIHAKSIIHYHQLAYIFVLGSRKRVNRGYRYGL